MRFLDIKVLVSSMCEIELMDSAVLVGYCKGDIREKGCGGEVVSIFASEDGI